MKNHRKVIWIAMLSLLPLGGGLAGAQERPAVEKLSQQNGEVFLKRQMPDVRERFGVDPVTEEAESHQDPLWMEYLERPHPSVATFERYFQEAERRYGVPADLLKAIAQVESNWTQYGPTVDQGWGVMHLVKNNYADTLGKAARLLRVEEQALKDDARLNILGAAAVMSDAAGKRARKFTRLEDWLEAAKVVSGLIDEPTRQLQAETYYRVLRTGAKSDTLWGEKIALPARPEVDIAENLSKLNAGEKSLDYGPALTDLTTCNYDAGRGGVAVNTWVNHWIASGTYAGAISWFKNCGAQASAHFVIRASDGQITQVVRTANTAWHAGNYPVNQRSIGVEHEVTAANPNGWYNMTLITASTDMARHFAGVHGIMRGHRNPGIVGHGEVTATACPGSTMPWGVWMNKLNGGPGGCFCGGGISWWGKTIPAGDAYCGMRVCGGYNSTAQLFECQAGGWVAQGTLGCNCQCTGGFNKYGDPIDPHYTYCGMRVCGMNLQNYECRAGGWVLLGGSC